MQRKPEKKHTVMSNKLDYPPLEFFWLGWCLLQHFVEVRMSMEQPCSICCIMFKPTDFNAKDLANGCQALYLKTYEIVRKFNMETNCTLNKPFFKTAFNFFIISNQWNIKCEILNNAVIFHLIKLRYYPVLCLVEAW